MNRKELEHIKKVLEHIKNPNEQVALAMAYVEKDIKNYDSRRGQIRRETDSFDYGPY